MTALMEAATRGHKEVIELLLDHGADPSAVDWVRGNDDDDVDDHSLI
jgi:ankyrin repeat protein